MIKISAMMDMSFEGNVLGKNWSDEVPYYTIIRGASKQFCYGGRRRVKQRVED